MITSDQNQATSVTTELVTPTSDPAQTGNSQVSSSVDWASIVAQIQAGDATGLEQLYRVFSRGLRFF
jgi:hypothetical protein